jgi:hypothetical protein
MLPRRQATRQRVQRPDLVIPLGMHVLACTMVAIRFGAASGFAMQGVEQNLTPWRPRAHQHLRLFPVDHRVGRDRDASLAERLRIPAQSDGDPSSDEGAGSFRNELIESVSRRAIRCAGRRDRRAARSESSLAGQRRDLLT